MFYLNVIIPYQQYHLPVFQACPFSKFIQSNSIWQQTETGGGELINSTNLEKGILI